MSFKTFLNDWIIVSLKLFRDTKFDEKQYWKKTKKGMET
jgi:hypothetical protein